MKTSLAGNGRAIRAVPALLLTVLIMFFSIGANQSGNKESAVIDFIIETHKVITIGEIDVIEAEFSPAGASSANIVWTSSDTSVATVSAEGAAGIVTAKSRGTTTITAMLNLPGGRAIARSTELRVTSKGRDSILVLDVSGSMNGRPIEEMKKAAIKFCSDLLVDENNNRVGLVCYDSNIYTFDLTDDLEALIREINYLSSGSATNMEGGLAEAKRMMDSKGASGAIRNIVLLTDGCPNEGATSASGSFRSATGGFFDYYGYEYFNAVVDTAEAIKASYNLYSLGFFHALYGLEKDDAIELMRKIAKPDTADKTYFYTVDNAEDLGFIFGDIGDTINLGSRITINIACPVDVDVTYKGEMLSSARSKYNDTASFGTLQLIGKNKDIKVLTLDYDKVYDVALQGTGDGLMDYSIYYIDENESIVDYRRFYEVPVTEQTKMYMSTDNSVGANVDLKIDMSGDGGLEEVMSAGKNTEILYTPGIIIGYDPSSGMNSNASTAIAITVVLAIILTAVIIIVAVHSANSKKQRQPSAYMRSGQSRSRGPYPYYPEQDYTSRATQAQFAADTPASLRAGAQAYGQGGSISILSGPYKGMTIPIKDGEVLNFGKDPKMTHVVFSDDYTLVSRLHCIVSYSAQSEEFYVTDCSSNGTFRSNRIRLEKGKRIPIEPGTVIFLADEQCSVLLNS